MRERANLRWCLYAVAVLSLFLFLGGRFGAAINEDRLMTRIEAGSDVARGELVRVVEDGRFAALGSAVCFTVAVAGLAVSASTQGPPVP